MTARVKTRFVVRRGRIGEPLSFSLNLRGRGAKIDIVPVPVLRIIVRIKRFSPEANRTHRSGRRSPVSKISRTRSRY
jgi:hypothetical protein